LEYDWISYSSSNRGNGRRTDERRERRNRRTVFEPTVEDSEWSVDRSYRSPSPSLVNEEELSEREQEEHTDVEVVDIGFIDTRTTRTDANDTMSRWLVTARTSQEAQQMAVAVKKEDRDKLSADALLKLQKSSTIGMTNKFALMNHTTDDQLEWSVITYP
jgi:hypothetical protein